MKIHFLLPKSFAEILEKLPGMRLGVDYPYWLGGRFTWPAQGWLMLREYREGLTIGTEPVHGCVNVGHVMTWREIGERRGEFRLALRCDWPRLYDVDFEVVQNPSVRTGRNAIYLPIWPVPGVIPRDANRSGVKTIAYAGRIGPINLASDLQSALSASLAGFDFRVIPSDRWHDLSGVDVLVAIRSFDRRTHDSKPPAKLFSAWRAGIPLIAGWDSAFSCIGVPGKDYLRVSSKDEFVQALTTLATDQKAYDALVAAGRLRAPESTHEAIAKVWLDAFDGPVRQAFEQWSEHGSSARAVVFGRAADRLRDLAGAAKASLRQKPAGE